jgi:enamine deaminase RidA (YjgF/YER057c/UK114 family)
VPDATRRYRDGGGGWEDAAGYSRGVRRHGHIAISGTTATAGDGTALHPGDSYAQAHAAIARALKAVEALGGHAEDVVRSRLYLAPDADWEAATRAHAELLGAVAPANTTLYVAGLIGEGFLVEVELEAELPPENGSPARTPSSASQT